MAKFSINLKKGQVQSTSKNQPLIIGIDLGTTHSLVAYTEDGVTKVISDPNQNTALVPSIVHITNQGEIIVGQKAKDLLVLQPQNTIHSIKRILGKTYKDIEKYDDTQKYQILESPTDENSIVKIQLGDRFYSPVELSGQILFKLKKIVEKQLEKKVSKAVITVPAYFNDAQRQATRDAGKLAGLDVLRIINEPTAASLAYGINHSDSQTIAVYDLGGGTFDISILSLEDGIFEVLSTHGNTSLGGDDIDQAIIDHWLITSNELKEKLAKSDPKDLQQIRLFAEKAKIQLTTENAFKDKIFGVYLDLNKTEFSHIIQPIISQTLKSCSQALKDSKLNIQEIDHVITVGGSTRIPVVKKMVGYFFQKKVKDHLHPDHVIAIGAAIQADILAGNQKNILLLDITPLSLGIETVGGLMDIILPRNSKVPISVARNYTTSVDGQKKLKVAVYQGERDLVKDNRKLAEFILANIPPMPAGIPKIQISFIIDADGILKVSAQELRSGVNTQVNIQSAYSISEEEMGEMLLDSIQNAKSDLKQRSLLEAKNEANSIAQATKKFIDQNQQYLNENQIQTLEKLRQDLINAINGLESDPIHKAIKKINEYSQPLAHEALDRNIALNIKGTKL